MPRKTGRISGISESTVAAVKSRYQAQVERLRQPSSGNPMGWAAADLILFEARRAWCDMQSCNSAIGEEVDFTPQPPTQLAPQGTQTKNRLSPQEREKIIKELGF